MNASSNLLGTWLTLIPLVTFSLGVDSRSKSLLIPKAESPSVPPLCYVPSSILTLKLAIDSLHGKILADKIISFISASPAHSNTFGIKACQINTVGPNYCP